MSSNLAPICQLIKSTYAADIAAQTPAAAILPNIIAALDATDLNENRLASRTLPACRHLPTSIANADGTRLQSIAEELGKVGDQLHWVQNTNYTSDKVGADYLENYAYTLLVGPTGHIFSPDILISILLIGPHQLYPPHHHPAAEVYHVISGDPLWLTGSPKWYEHPTGQPIYHPPWITHATQMRKQPLLAIASWWGDINTAADLT